MAKKRSSLSVMILGGAIGASIGVLMFLSDGPDSLYPRVTAFSSPLHPENGAEMHVEVLGKWNYTRYAKTLDEFKTEINLLRNMPPIMVFVFCVIVGSQVFRISDKFIRGEFRQPAS